MKPYLTTRDNLTVGIKLTGMLPGKTFGHVNTILKDRKNVEGIALAAVTPAAHNVDKVLETWVRAGVLTKFDITKTGFYVLIVKDGDERLATADLEKGTAEHKAYVSSCTRINLSNPRAVAGCNLPSIANLRKIARRSHFVATTGDVIKLPGNYRWANQGAKTPFISKTENMDEIKHDADESLKAFLRQSGIHTERRQAQNMLT